MRPFRLLLPCAVSLVVLLLLVVPARLSADIEKSPATLAIHSYQGEVRLSVAGKESLIPLSRGTQGKFSDQDGLGIVTAQGHIVFDVNNEVEITQNADTTLTFHGYAQVDKGQRARVAMAHGSVYVYFEPRKHNSLLFEAPGLALRVTRKTSFQVKSDADAARVTVWKGKVEATAGGRTVTLSEGDVLDFAPGTLFAVDRGIKPSSSFARSSWQPLFWGIGYSSCYRYYRWYWIPLAYSGDCDPVLMYRAAWYWCDPYGYCPPSLRLPAAPAPATFLPPGNRPPAPAPTPVPTIGPRPPLRDSGLPVFAAARSRERYFRDQGVFEPSASQPARVQPALAQTFRVANRPAISGRVPPPVEPHLTTAKVEVTHIPRSERGAGFSAPPRGEFSPRYSGGASRAPSGAPSRSSSPASSSPSHSGASSGSRSSPAPSAPAAPRTSGGSRPGRPGDY